jgi:predicted ATPase/transcriptional regulator with XRE-family HTH domain
MAQSVLTFGQWVKQRRKELGCSQQELGDLVGCSKWTIVKIEADIRRPSRQIAERLADCLEIAPAARAAFIRSARVVQTASPEAVPFGAVTGEDADQDPPTNLPARLTSIVGREMQMAEVYDLLVGRGVRLLTLTGPPGIGKSRLAVQVGWELLPHFPDGVYFVPLAAIHDPDLVPACIAQMVGIGGPTGGSLGVALVEYLRPKRTLLILDNFEQLVTAAPFVVELLEQCPAVTALVTSRAVLHMRGEHQFPVPPLALPDPEHLPPLPELADYPAVALFRERAQAVRRDFALTVANGPVVAEICTRLDGIPLAIELVAARIGVLNPEALRARLGNRLALLTSGPRDLPVRHQTLRGAIDWSYDMLAPPEQTLFAQLGVFIGCTLDAVEAVIGGQWAVGSGQPLDQDPQSAVLSPQSSLLDTLDALVQKSLLRHEEETTPDGYPELRFRMLETIREYAVERLAAGGADAALRDRHAAFYLALAEQAEPELSGGQQSGWLARLQREHANLRAALGWLLEREHTERALRMTKALNRFWRVRGHLTEGRKWAAAALAQAGDGWPELRGRVLHGAGTLAVSQGDYAEATALYREALAVCEALGDKVGAADALNSLGIIADTQGDYAQAVPLYEASLALRRAIGDQRGIGASLNNLGMAALYTGHYDQATALFAESLAIFRTLGDTRTIATLVNNIGLAALYTGDFARATQYFEEALALYRQVDDRWSIAGLLNNLGEVARRQGDSAQAVLLNAESVAHYRELGARQGLANALNNLAEALRDQGDYDQARTVYTEVVALLHTLEDRYHLAAVLTGIASLAILQGQAECAARLLGVAAALREKAGTPIPPADRAEHDHYLARVRATLAADAFAAAWAAGQAMALPEVVAYALKACQATLAGRTEI